MATQHTVQQGEHLSAIARQHGFADYHTIWEDAGNAELRSRRQSPNVLHPGDRVHIPDKQEKQESGRTERRHRFRLLGEPLMLRIRLQDLDDQPIANTPCQLEVEGTTYQLVTNAEGLIEQRIAPTARTGRLLFRNLEVPLRIGHLDPLDERTGWRARLNNLGYDAGESDDPEDPRLRSAIEEFQCDYDLTVDGLCGPQTQGKLFERHRC